MRSKRKTHSPFIRRWPELDRSVAEAKEKGCQTESSRGIPVAGDSAPVEKIVRLLPKRGNHGLALASFEAATSSIWPRMTVGQRAFNRHLYARAQEKVLLEADYLVIHPGSAAEEPG